MQLQPGDHRQPRHGGGAIRLASNLHNRQRQIRTQRHEVVVAKQLRQLRVLPGRQLARTFLASRWFSKQWRHHAAQHILRPATRAVLHRGDGKATLSRKAAEIF